MVLPGPPTLPSPPDEVPPGWGHRGNRWKRLALELEKYQEVGWHKSMAEAIAKLAALAREP